MLLKFEFFYTETLRFWKTWLRIMVNTVYRMLKLIMICCSYVRIEMFLSTRYNVYYEIDLKNVLKISTSVPNSLFSLWSLGTVSFLAQFWADFTVLNSVLEIGIMEKCSCWTGRHDYIISTNLEAVKKGVSLNASLTKIFFRSK